jgi:predicted N-acetyltransferase YhbS
MADFVLRAMVPTDGPALDELLSSEAQTGRMRMTTHYLRDVHSALVAQHPGVFGVVAESPEVAGLAGMATAFLDRVRAGGDVGPVAYLENLKVHHHLRRRGLGGRLAAWRIEEARRRSGDDVLIATGIEAGNTASLATARRWATQVLGPVRVVVAGTRRTQPTAAGLEVRPLMPADRDAVAGAVNTFHAGYELFPQQTAERLADAHAPTADGEAVRQYRVVASPTGEILAGASVMQRFALMVDHIDAVPLVISIVGRLTGMLPADRVLRSIELSLVWHAPGRADALALLWDAIRWEWRDRCTSVTTIADPRGPMPVTLAGVSRFGPRIELRVPVRAPRPLDEAKPVYLWR